MPLYIFIYRCTYVRLLNEYIEGHFSYSMEISNLLRQVGFIQNWNTCSTALIIFSLAIEGSIASCKDCVFGVIG